MWLKRGLRWVRKAYIDHRSATLWWSFSCGLAPGGDKLSNMSLSSIRMTPEPDHPESLAIALRALLSWAGEEVDYRTITAALGLSLITAVRDPEACLVIWVTQGRDALLAEAAPCFGLRIRDLHPPEAAVGIERAPEFAQHFEASYRPLIEKALANNQPVLARSGWPGEASGHWGIITAGGGPGMGLRGTSLDSGGATVTMTAPPVQAYVIEELKPRVQSAGELLRLAVNSARTILHNETDPRFGITTGPEVYASWRERLRHEHVCAACDDSGAKGHRQMAYVITCARRDAAEFFSRYVESVAGDARKLIERIASECDAAINVLAPSCDLCTVEDAVKNERGRGQLAEAVTAAQTHETKIKTYITDLRV